MENNDLSLVEKRLVARFLDMFIKFGLILALGSFCFTVFSPFMNMMLWALILAVTLYPLHQRFAARLGGKQGQSSTPAGPAGHPAHRGPHRGHARLPG